MSAAGVEQSFRREDTRLTSKRVTLEAPALFLGELLERLQRQTGVQLSLSGEGAPDFRVCCVVKDRPLADVMDAVWSLMSYRGAEWHWERRPGKETFSYRLIRTLPAMRLARELRGQVEERFADHTRQMLGAVGNTPGPAPDPDSPEGKLLTSPRLRSGLGLFARSLPPAAQEEVTRRGAVRRVPVSELDAEGREFVEGIWKNSQSPNATAPLRRPEWIEFRTARLGANVSPSLFIQLDGLGGYAYLGGDPLENEAREALDKRWFLPGDLPADQLTPAEGVAPAPAPRPADLSLAGRVRSLAERYGVPVLAYLPVQTGVSRRSAAAPTTLAEALKQLKEQDPFLVSKSRNGVLLFRYRAWFLMESDPPALTWALYQKVRPILGETEQPASLEAYARVSSLASLPQMVALSGDYPLLLSFARWREPFVALAREGAWKQKVLSEKGVSLQELASLSPQWISPGLSQALASGEINSAYLKVENAASPTEWTAALILRKKDGRELPVLHLSLPKHPEFSKP